MDTVAASAWLSRDEVFVELVGFKWLMADLGCWIDLPRMRNDCAYAHACASHGLHARSAVLRQRSRELLARLHAPVPAPPWPLDETPGPRSPEALEAALEGFEALKP